MSEGEAFASWWLLGGLVWGPLCYAGCLARAQRGYPLGAAKNFRTDVACALVVGVAVFLFPLLGPAVYWLARGFDRGLQWWRGDR